MNFFRDLGLTILERWQRADFDGRAFPDIAAAALSERPPSRHVDPIDVIRWVHETPALVPQADLRASFGQPPITVFQCERFHIDVLFWVDGTTSIHQHGFSGAFHVMQGSSIESNFRFAPRRRYSEYLMSGKLELNGVELRAKGDVRAVPAGPEFVHALFHLDRPSVSVVVRNPSDALAGPQYSYLRAGLAYDGHAKTEAMTRTLQTLDLLRAIDSPEFESLARASVLRADSFLALKILMHLGSRMEPHERYVAFLRTLLPAHEELVGVLLAHAERDRRERHIISRRQLAKQAEHRFFLALLLNLDHRAGILDMVRRGFPDREPVNAIMGWLEELQKLDAIHAWVSETSKTSAAPIVDMPLDERTLRIARHWLEGKADEGLPEADVLARRAALRGSLLLGPLFAEAPL